MTGKEFSAAIFGPLTILLVALILGYALLRWIGVTA